MYNSKPIEPNFEKLYKNLIENSDDIIYTIDKDGKLFHINSTARKILGYEIEEIFEKNYYDLVHPNYVKKIKYTYLKQISLKKVFTQLEFPIMTKNGDYIWLSQKAVTIFNKGKFDGLQITAKDITDQVTAKNSDSNSKINYRNIFDSAPIGIYQSDMNGNLIIANKAFIDILGYDSISEILKVNMKDIYFDEEERKNLINKFLPIGAGLASVHWKKKDGTKILVQLSSHAVKNNKGDTSYFEGFIIDITKQKKADERLQLLGEAIKATGEGISITDLDNNLIFVNNTFKKIYGYKENEIIGKNISVLYSKNSIDQEHEKQQLTANNTRWEARVENVRRDGTCFPAYITTSAVKNENDITYALVRVTKDLTQILITQNALKESEERYRSIFEHTSVSMLLIDLSDESIKGANDAACKYYGYNKDQITSMNLKDIWVTKSIKPFKELLQSNPNKNKEMLCKHKNAFCEIRDVEVHYSVINIGSKEHIFAIINDVSDRIKTETELEEYKIHLENIVEERTKKLDEVNKQLKSKIDKLLIAEENIKDQLTFLQTLIDTIPNQIFICNAEKKYIGCNKAFAEFHGITSSELFGKTVYDLTNRVIADFHNRMDDDLLQKQASQKFETTIFDLDGHEHQAIAYKATFNKADGTIGGFVGILLDITDLKKMEREIRSSLEREKELNNLKSRFISVASHEFRTPLTTILSSADVLELYGRKWPEEKYYKYLSNIQTSVEYMTQLINEVLFVGKSEAGKIQNNPANLDLQELIYKILQNFKLSTTEKKSFSFEYNVDEKFFFLDNKLLTQILTNLLSNAVKYSMDNGKISLNVSKKKNNLFISVSDDGIGIPSKDQKLLFEPFHRATNVGSISGTGLGLSIAYKSAEIMGGRLYVKSKKNKGSKFTFELNLENCKS